MCSTQSKSFGEGENELQDLGIIDLAAQSPALQPYDVQQIAGEGSYSTVYMAVERDGGRRVAIKALLKAQLTKLGKCNYAYVERDCYKKTSHPAIIRLYDTLQDHEYLYFILEYVPNRNLRHYIDSRSPFSTETAKFYTAEIISGVGYLHEIGIVHRDLKPENILLDEKMHAKICDFGSALILSDVNHNPISDGNRRFSFVGTAQFCPPEMLEGKISSAASDIWSIGCILYTLLEGTSPFDAATEYLIFKKISQMSYSIPSHIDEHARSVISSVLVPIAERLNMRALKSHSFFSKIDWDNIHSMPSPLCPLPPLNSEVKNSRDKHLSAKKLTHRFGVLNVLISKSLSKVRKKRNS